MNVHHKVYWTYNGVVYSEDFGIGQLSNAMQLCETLRKERYRGEHIEFVSCATELPDCTSLEGVAAPGVGYNWKKRR